MFELILSLVLSAFLMGSGKPVDVYPAIPPRIVDLVNNPLYNENSSPALDQALNKVTNLPPSVPTEVAQRIVDHVSKINEKVEDKQTQNSEKKDGGDGDKEDCIPLPVCMYTEPRCLMPIDDRNWCPIPSLTPTPTTTPRPELTCIPRPPCLDAHPACLMMIPKEGYCPNPTPTPTDCTIKDSCGTNRNDIIPTLTPEPGQVVISEPTPLLAPSEVWPPLKYCQGSRELPCVMDSVN